ncbi:MAG: hypothetical protein DMF56_25895 [Acidobacteria bacterium]|nr:MAG: hypothetical protein DMF56_25895 [Acidobacteriota bacterium]
MSPDEQIDLCYRYGYLAECNEAMARMYGFTSPDEVIGARLGDMLMRDKPENIEFGGCQVTMRSHGPPEAIDTTVSVFSRNACLGANGLRANGSSGVTATHWSVSAIKNHC